MRSDFSLNTQTRKTAVQYSYVNNSVTVRVCVCATRYIQFAGNIDIICSYVESNSVRLVGDDDTTSAVSPTRR